MKKLLLIMMALVVVLAIASCEEVHVHTRAHEPVMGQEPTCGEDGFYFVVCSVCDEVMETIVLDKTGDHTERLDPYVEPTCADYGLTEGKSCSVCNTVLVAQEPIEKKEHTFGEWETVRLETMHEDLLLERYCSCGEVESKTVDNYSVGEPSVGLEFELLENGSGYRLISMGSCRDEFVIIPEAYNGLPVKEIGDQAFHIGRDVLVRVFIPNSVNVIGQGAFGDCSLLQYVYIGVESKLVIIKDIAFSGCSSLKEIFLPRGLTQSLSQAFNGCASLQKFEVDEHNLFYTAIDGNLYSKDKKTLIHYACGKTATSFTIPEFVTEISLQAFVGEANLKEIYIHENVTKIGLCAFQLFASHATIYCEAESKPEGWDDRWVEGFSDVYVIDVVWGYEE